MRSKRINGLFRMFMVLAMALFVTVVIRGVNVHADNGETVRVSTSKELSAAIKNADVGTIIFRTQAYISVTIKQNKAAAEKFLIVDAPNASITNKAVFAGIDILSAKSYTESVSGNNISLSDAVLTEGLTVAKKKQVESLTVYTTYGYFELNHVLRKSAKIKNISLVFAGFDAPIESTYNSKKRQHSLKYDLYGTNLSLKITFDKSGRKKNELSKGDFAEYDYEYNYTYDSNGNIIKQDGYENIGGKFSTVNTYNGNLLQKSEYKDETSSGITEYTYDEKGRVIKTVYNGKSSMDGLSFMVKNVETFEYDSKGRLIYESAYSDAGEYFSEISYTYNSKGFLTKKYINSSGSETEVTYKYNKAGDETSEKYVSEGYNETYTYKYDELGNKLY